MSFVAAALMVSLLVPAAVQDAAKKSNDASVARHLNTFSTIVRELEENYVDSIDMDKTFKTAIASMLSTVDPYTEYYTADAREDLEKMTTGEYGGIGSTVTERNGSTYISEPMEGSPAMRAGLLPGDLIARVDTTDTRGMKYDKVSALLRGKPGTRVHVEVVRPYVTDSLLSFDIQRAKLQTPSVLYFGMLDDGIGYIALTQYIDKSPDEVSAAIDSLQKQGPLRGLVLDVRSNGGGLLESAVSILGDFLPKGTEVLRTRGRNSEEERIYKTTHKPVLPDLPLVLLIDGGSASATEITAGALQDLDRAVLVGSRSFGKGLVQSTRPLPSDGLLKLTVSKYYIPSGRLIQALDYSHRNPDGSVARTPDSLTNVYYTKAGREVRDGGGLKPDIEIDWGKTSSIMYPLMKDFWIFDYANKYAAEHPTLPAPEKFEVTDEIYEDFTKFIDPEKFKYDKLCDDALKYLRDIAEAEGYLNDSTKTQMDLLGKMLTHNLQSDLELKRPEISEYLGEEIVSRYYNTRGRMIQQIKTDKGVKEAVALLKDPKRYNSILTTPADKSAVKKGDAAKGKKESKSTSPKGKKK